jgi:hypothetical protein
MAYHKSSGGHSGIPYVAEHYTCDGYGARCQNRRKKRLKENEVVACQFYGTLSGYEQYGYMFVYLCGNCLSKMQEKLKNQLASKEVPEKQENQDHNLIMRFHKRSGRYQIFVVGDNRLANFPSEDRICALWNELFPDIDFSVGSSVDLGPLDFFYADVGRGTTPKERQAFCDTLSKECAFSEKSK